MKVCILGDGLTSLTLAKALVNLGIKVDIYDPWVNIDEAKLEYDVNIIPSPDLESYEAIILAVAHDEFCSAGQAGIKKFGKPKHVIYDLKSVLPLDGDTIRL